MIRLRGEAWFHCKMQALAKEQRFGVEDRLYPSKPTRHGREKEPLVIRLRRIRAGMRNYGANLGVILNRDKLLRVQYLRTGKPWVAGGFAGSNFMPCEIFPPFRGFRVNGLAPATSRRACAACPVEKLPAGEG